MEFIPKLISGDYTKEELEQINEKCDKYCINPEDVADGILVDPSFHRILKITDDSFPEGYTIHKYSDIDKDIDSGDMTIPRGTPVASPLGFVKDIAPELSLNKKFLDVSIVPDDIVGLSMKDYGFIVDPSIIIIKKDGTTGEILNIEELGENHPLFNFLITH